MSRKLIASLALAAAITTGGMGAASAAEATPSAAPVATSVASTASVVRPNARTMYLASTHSGGTARLQLVERASGRTLATLATAPMVGYANYRENPFLDATIAPDGTVYAVRTDGSTYGTTLLQIKNGHAAAFMSYVQAVRVSPDGTRLAVTVLSPDVNHDGRGAVSVRVGSVKGGRFATLTQKDFPVSRENGGDPAIQLAVPYVRTWLGNHHVAVSAGCCDSGSVITISADRGTKTLDGAPGAYGSGLTDVVAKPDVASALVPVETGYETRDHEWITTGYDIRRVTPAVPRGTKVAHVKDLQRYFASSGATIVDAGYTHPRYVAVKGVVRDENFLGR